MRRLYIGTLIVILTASLFIILLPADSLNASNGSTTLSFQPDMVEVPCIDLEYSMGLFYIDLYLSNVQDLRSFKLTIIFDGDVLYIPDNNEGGRPRPSNWSGGGTSDGTPGYGSYTYNLYTLMNPLSGSGILLKFWFRPRAPGTTEIQFREVELRDSNDVVIPVITEGTVVNVLPLDTWIDGEYENLSAEYEELQTQYNDMEEVLDTLSNEYDSLDSSYTYLQEEYTLLSSRHALLESNYTALNSSYDSLEEDYSSLNGEYTALESDYDGLSLEHQSTVEQLEETTTNSILHRY